MKILLRTLFVSLLILSTAACAHTAQTQSAIKAFATEMESKHGFDKAELESMLTATKFRDDIIKAITRPAEAKPWHEYRPIFLKPGRIDGGVKFWQENETLLNQAEQEYGVPPEIIVAIIGVETRYGKHTGRYRVLDALTTLAFGYPKRAKFFRKELEEFLLLSREEQVDPSQAKGSYAGAMGKPQFISSSYRAYAVDQDRDGRRDLWNNNADIIGSVANYFNRHGWRPGDMITQQVSGGKGLERFVQAGMKPSFQVAELLSSGLRPLVGEPPAADALSNLIKLDAGEKDEYWLGLHNFYVITRYNHSNLYAMATYQLSQEILAARQAN
ncbi:MAG: lytic murein transglycosylase B [Gammaproteobacteria bacterium]|nr:lytic murein transglycosylase B [Gammaproteobacteria bacterium]